MVVLYATMGKKGTSPLCIIDERGSSTYRKVNVILEEQSGLIISFRGSSTGRKKRQGPTRKLPFLVKSPGEESNGKGRKKKRNHRSRGGGASSRKEPLKGQTVTGGIHTGAKKKELGKLLQPRKKKERGRGTEHWPYEDR